MLDQAFDKLKTLDWGSDPSALKPIDDALNSAHGDADATAKIESQLLEVLSSSVGVAAKDFVFRRLMRCGTDASVPALAKLLGEPEQSHMARYALERIDSPAAAAAMRDALGSVGSAQKVGIIGSLGVRQDEDSVEMLSGMLSDSDGDVATAAAIALGAIRSPAAAKALMANKASDDAAAAATDAMLACAESLVASGDKGTAKGIYRQVMTTTKDKHVKVAATRGMLSTAGG